MRNVEDIKKVRFNLMGILEIDMERVEDDPTWRSFLGQVGRQLATPEEALGAYLRFYLSREDFPLQLPASNGPADFVGLEVEVLNAERGKDH